MLLKPIKIIKQSKNPDLVDLFDGNRKDKNGNMYKISSNIKIENVDKIWEDYIENL